MATPTELQQLYLAYFGRPADPGGIVFYANTPVATVLQGFSASPESRALYGAGFSTASVKAIYTYLFNRPAADSEAAFWVGVVNAPNSAVSPAAAALTILQSAHNDDLAGISNKLAVAANFTASLDTAAKLNGYSGDVAAQAARSFLSTVDASSGSVIAANTLVSTQKTGVPVATVIDTKGSTFFLSLGVDHIVGTAGPDTITGFAGFPGNSSSYATSDFIDGGAGIDTLVLSVQSSLALPAANIRNIEKLQVSSGGSSIDLQGVAGLTDLMNQNSGGVSPWDLAFNNVANNVGISIVNSSGRTTVGVVAAALAGNADVANVTVSGVGDLVQSSTGYATLFLGAATANTNEYESLTINSTGSGPNALAVVTDSVQTSLKSVVIQGPAALQLDLSAGDRTIANLASIDASGASAGVVLNLHNGFNAGLSITGGSGFDALRVSAPVTSLANVRNFEELRLDVTASTTQDAGIASLTGYSFGVTDYGPNDVVRLANLASGVTTTVYGNAQTLQLALKNPAGSSDSLTLALSPTSYLGANIQSIANVAGLETLRLQSKGGNGFGSYGNNSINSDLVTAAQVLTGNEDLYIVNPLLTSSFDASGFAGRLIASLGSSTATNLKVGAGGSSITLAAGGTTVAHGITLGVGGDILQFLDNNASGNGGASSAAGFVHVSNFGVGDTLGFGYSHGNYSLRDAGGTAHTGLFSGFYGLSGVVSGPPSMKTVAQNAAALSGTNMAVLKLSTGVAAGSTVAATFAQAMGTATITGLLPGGNYLVLSYDTTHAQAILGLVNSAANAVNDTVLSAADFTATGISVIGVLDMSASAYAGMSLSSFVFSY